MRNKKRLHRKVQYKNLMLRNLATSLILYEKIKTTDKKAKKVKKLVEKMIILGKRKDNASIRKLYQFFLDKNASKKIQEDLSEKFKNRKSGFIRIIRIGYRAGDAAPMVLMELMLPKKIEKKVEKEKVSTKVTTRIRTKETKAVKKEEIEKEKTPKKVEQKPIEKKSWLGRVSDTKIGKRIGNATKKIWTKRTTSK